MSAEQEQPSSRAINNGDMPIKVSIKPKAAPARLSKDVLQALKQHDDVRKIFLAAFGLWLLWQLFANAVALGTSHYSGVSDAVDKFLRLLTISLLIGAACRGYLEVTRRQYLKFDDNAVYVSVHQNFASDKTVVLPWKNIDRIGFDRTNADQKALLIFESNKRAARIKWEDVKNSVDTGNFITTATAKIPDAVAGVSFPGESTAPDDGSFTQLWFKYYTAGSERTRTTKLSPGDELKSGKYKILGTIGGGGQGTAYLAADMRPLVHAPKEVVLKEYILPVHRGENILRQTLEKLEQECATLRSLDHPNIVKTMGVFTEDHRGYLVLEYVEGRSLKSVVETEGPQPDNVVIELAHQVCNILEYLHSQTPPVVHRDLTPDNLILRPDGQLTLVDFNVAHQLASAATATVVGKHAYLPPEQFRGKPTTQSDIYAFGCTLHFLLTGQEPEPLTCSKPRTHKQNVCVSMDRVVGNATAIDTAKRYQTISEMRAALPQANSVHG